METSISAACVPAGDAGGLSGTGGTQKKGIYGSAAGEREGGGAGNIMEETASGWRMSRGLRLRCDRGMRRWRRKP